MCIQETRVSEKYGDSVAGTRAEESKTGFFEGAVQTSITGWSGGVAVVLGKGCKGRRLRMEASKKHPGRIIAVRVEITKGVLVNVLSVYACD